MRRTWCGWGLPRLVGLVGLVGCVDGTADLAGAPAPPCAERMEATRVVRVGAGPWGATELRLDAGMLYYRTAGPSGRGVVVRRDLEAGTEVLFTGPDDDGHVLAARGGGVLRTIADDGRIETWLDTAQGARVALEPLAVGDLAVPTWAFDGEELQNVDGGGAAYHVRGEIRWWSGGGIERRRPTASRQVSSIALTGHQLVFATRGQTGGVIQGLYEDAHEAETFASSLGLVQHLVVDGRAAYFLDDGALRRLDLDDGAVTTLDAGPCGPPSASAGRAVAACTDEPSTFPALGTYLAFFDGTSTTRRYDGGGFYYAPRLRAARLAWLDYVSPDVVCQGGLADAAVVRVVDLVRPDEVLTLGSVGAPCLCCGRFWPPAELGFDGRFVAYTYAGTPAEEALVEAYRVDGVCP